MKRYVKPDLEMFDSTLKADVLSASSDYDKDVTFDGSEFFNN